jgi:thiol-disulfide isomerase/thioredoxin
VVVPALALAGCASRQETVARRRAAPPTPAPTPVTAPLAARPAYVRPAAPQPVAPVASPPAAPYAPVAGGAIPWDARDLSLEQAVAAGRAAGKPVALYILASWCGYCRKLEQNALVDGGVQAEMRAFYNVRVDPDSATGRPLRRFAPGGFPTIVVLDASGNQKTALVGNRPAADLTAKLRSAR